MFGAGRILLEKLAECTFSLFLIFCFILGAIALYKSETEMMTSNDRRKWHIIGGVFIALGGLLFLYRVWTSGCSWSWPRGPFMSFGKSRRKGKGKYKYKRKGKRGKGRKGKKKRY